MYKYECAHQINNSKAQRQRKAESCSLRALHSPPLSASYLSQPSTAIRSLHLCSCLSFHRSSMKHNFFSTYTASTTTNIFNMYLHTLYTNMYIYIFIYIYIHIPYTDQTAHSAGCSSLFPLVVVVVVDVYQR